MKKTKLIFFSAAIIGLLSGCSDPEKEAAAYIASAEVFLEENNLEKAAIEYRNAIQINQNAPDAWYGLARVHERKQEWTQAFKALSKIRDTNPNHLNGRIMLAQMQLAANNIDQALEHANHVMELAPQDTRAHSLMAAVRLRMGDLEAAHEFVDKAFALDHGNENKEATLLKAHLQIMEQNFEQAINTLNSALETQADEASLYLLKIQALKELGNESAIRDVHETLVRQFPENFGFKNALVRIYVQMGEIDAAERFLEQVVEENPERVDAKELLVGFRNQYRSLDDAIALTKKYIEADPEEYQLRFLLGELYFRDGQTDKAMSVYQGIVTDDDVKPNGLEARNKLAFIYLKTERPDKSKALVEEVLANEQGNRNALLLHAGFKIAALQY
ncbi:MAG: tetratricopeptide repeat protein [Gammaproteobacteria bacterium]|nr:tetratricopeptide repeat protein [Gammaproteobacteria bacterium]